jgi:hypothetical protein
MTDWVALRRKWADARDKAGVKKGAVSGISMGDAIEKIGKAKGYVSQTAYLNALKDDITKYKSKIQKSNPELCKWIDKNLADEVKDYSARVAMDIESLKWMVKNLMAPSDANILTILPDEGMLQNAVTLMRRKDDPLSFADAIKQVRMFAGVEKDGAVIKMRAKTMKEMSWLAKLSGHDADYAELKTFADIVASDVKEVRLWSKTDNLSDWADCLKRMKMKQTSVEALPHAQKAVKALLT